MISRRALLTSTAIPVLAGFAPTGLLLSGAPSAPSAPPSLDLIFGGPMLDPRLTFTRGSTATYFDVNGTMQTVSGNAPRFDYDPVTHAPNGLLIEEQRTNLLLNSATLGTQSVAVTAQAYTLSFYGTGTVTLSGVSTAGPLTGSGAFPSRVSLLFTPTAGTLTLTVTGSVLNAQLEAGAFPTSYIPTTGAAVTRAVDVLTIQPANMSPWFNAGPGSWMIAATSYPPVGTARRLINHLSNPGVYPLWQQNTNNLFSYDGVSNLGTVATIIPGVPFSGASTWNTGGAGTICLNGGAVNSNSAQTTGFASLLTTGVKFFADPSGTNQNTGYIRRVRYWPRVLSNTELQQVTA